MPTQARTKGADSPVDMPKYSSRAPSRKAAVATSLTFVLGFTLFATVFIVPVHTQRLLGYTALETGMLFIPGDPATDGRLSALTHVMLSSGATAWETSRRAIGLLDMVVQRQAGLLSYLDAFRFVEFLSLVCAPLILVVGRTRPLTKIALAATSESH